MDGALLAQVPGLRDAVADNIEHYRFREALKEAMNLARLGNKYLTDTEPWKVAKTDMDRTASILNVCLKLCADLAVVFAPFLPFSSEKLLGILNLDKDVLRWDNAGRDGVIPAGHVLGKPDLLFEKVEDAEIDRQMARLEAIKEANMKAAAASLPVEAQKAGCTFDDFSRMDIRTATVLEAEKVPKTDKLLKLTVDTGIDKRIIVLGIAQYYSPEQMLGKQICILANLEPRKIRGIESRGMILMARQPDGTMRVVSPEERLADGSTVG